MLLGVAPGGPVLLIGGVGGWIAVVEAAGSGCLPRVRRARDRRCPGSVDGVPRRPADRGGLRICGGAGGAADPHPAGRCLSRRRRRAVPTDCAGPRESRARCAARAGSGPVPPGGGERAAVTPQPRPGGAVRAPAQRRDRRGHPVVRFADTRADECDGSEVPFNSRSLRGGRCPGKPAAWFLLRAYARAARARTVLGPLRRGGRGSQPRQSSPVAHRLAARGGSPRRTGVAAGVQRPAATCEPCSSACQLRASASRRAADRPGQARRARGVLSRTRSTPPACR